jgi:hypothetical protein
MLRSEDVGAFTEFMGVAGRLETAPIVPVTAYSPLLALTRGLANVIPAGGTPGELQSDPELIVPARAAAAGKGQLVFDTYGFVKCGLEPAPGFAGLPPQAALPAAERLTLPDGRLNVGTHLPLLARRYRYLSTLGEGVSAQVGAGWAAALPAGRPLPSPSAAHRVLGAPPPHLLQAAELMPSPLAASPLPPLCARSSWRRTRWRLPPDSWWPSRSCGGSTGRQGRG